MRTLHQYIGRSITSSFILTVLVLTFVMSLAGLFRITDLLARGAPLALIGRFFLWSMPALLMFTIPISVLTAILLVFGRLSHEGELTAMRACGISLWQVSRSPFMMAGFLSAVCLVLNFEIAPRIEQQQRAILGEMKADVMLSLLEEGQFVPMTPKVSVFIRRKTGSQLQGVVILEQNKGQTRRIEAERGTAEVTADGKFFQLDLHDVKITPFLDGKSASGFSERWPFRLPIAAKARTMKSTPSSLSTRDLIGELARFHPKTGSQPEPLEHLRMKVEVSVRFVLALGCVAFAFIGLPLGIRNPRRESSVSVGISLVLAFVFYLFLITGLTLARKPHLIPHLFVWLPIPLSVILGVWLIRRLN